MKAYYKKDYVNSSPVLLMLENENGRLVDKGTKGYIYKDGKWVDSPVHVGKILYEGIDYDEISEAEALKLMNK